MDELSKHAYKHTCIVEYKRWTVMENSTHGKHKRSLRTDKHKLATTQPQRHRQTKRETIVKGMNEKDESVCVGAKR